MRNHEAGKSSGGVAAVGVGSECNETYIHPIDTARPIYILQILQYTSTRNTATKQHTATPCRN